jgi:hypothetical protein
MSILRSVLFVHRQPLTVHMNGSKPVDFIRVCIVSTAYHRLVWRERVVGQGQYTTKSPKPKESRKEKAKISLNAVISVRVHMHGFHYNYA